MGKRITKDQRVDFLLKILEPCMVRQKGDYLGLRYMTWWGTKTTVGLRETIKRIMYDTDFSIDTTKEE